MKQKNIECDVHVVGAGFGGLACALRLCELGHKVVVSERLNYSGGCASTFTRFGRQFESGATLFSGFSEEQLFGRWIQKYGWLLTFEKENPLIRFRIGVREYCIPSERTSLLKVLDSMVSIQKKPALKKFLSAQKIVSDSVWPLFDSPRMLLTPKGNPREFLSQLITLFGALKAARYARWVGKPLIDVLKTFGLEGEKDLVTYLNALCQITLQCSVDEVESLFALVVMDYPLRGTGHINGGIGRLSGAMVQQIEALGGQVLFTNEIRSLDRSGDIFEASGRRFQVCSTHVVSNLLPSAITRLDERLSTNHRLKQLAMRTKESWSAVMLYGILEDDRSMPRGAHHIEIVADPSKQCVDGNHIFMSISGTRMNQSTNVSERTLTISTHLALEKSTSSRARQEVEKVQSLMWENVERYAPEISVRVTKRFTGSSRTFERFTARPKGAVGGVPKKHGLHNYTQARITEIESGHFMVGDSVFPGQSTLSVSIGGVMVAKHIHQMYGK